MTSWHWQKASISQGFTFKLEVVGLQLPTFPKDYFPNIITASIFLAFFSYTYIYIFLCVFCLWPYQAERLHLDRTAEFIFCIFFQPLFGYDYSQDSRVIIRKSLLFPAPVSIGFLHVKNVFSGLVNAFILVSPILVKFNMKIKNKL